MKQSSIGFFGELYKITPNPLAMMNFWMDYTPHEMKMKWIF
jgi:hypothetical protein